MESFTAATKSYRSYLSTTENYYIILPEELENAKIKVVLRIETWIQWFWIEKKWNGYFKVYSFPFMMVNIYLQKTAHSTNVPISRSSGEYDIAVGITIPE